MRCRLQHWLSAFLEIHDAAISNPIDPDCGQNEWMPFQIHPNKRFFLERLCRCGIGRQFFFEGLKSEILSGLQESDVIDYAESTLTEHAPYLKLSGNHLANSIRLN